MIDHEGLFKIALLTNMALDLDLAQQMTLAFFHIEVGLIG